MSPGRKQKINPRKDDDSIQTTRPVSFLDKQHSVLMVVADGSESMDIFLCSNVLSKFGMKVSIGALEESSDCCELVGGVRLVPDTTIQESQSYSIVVLPGGMRAVYQLMESEDFCAFLKNHIEERCGLVVAMGASATCLLPELGYVDKYGPICMPSPLSKMIETERNMQIWAAPGLTPAAHLSLAVGEHLCGRPRAQKVAELLSIPPLDNFRREIFIGGVKNTNTRQFLEQARHSTETQVEDTLKTEESKGGVDPAIVQAPETEGEAETFVDCLFEHVVWRRLQDLGWKRRKRREEETDSSSSSFSYRPPNEKVSLNNHDEVVQYLLKHPYWSSQTASFRIVDLFLSCRREHKTMTTDSPELVEKETKRRMPALATY